MESYMKFKGIPKMLIFITQPVELYKYIFTPTPTLYIPPI